MQRGRGTFIQSISGLKRLNKLGYGRTSDLPLNLVYNPIDDRLPPTQSDLEKLYKNELSRRYGIEFTNLFTLANMPIQRFANHLKALNKLNSYQELLVKSHNHKNLDSVMCRNVLSVNWKGYLFDCDFNQQLDMPINGKAKHLLDLLKEEVSLSANPINVDKHCYGCTAGSGSSCSGALM